MVLITIVTGAYKPTNITGGPHIVKMCTWTDNMVKYMLPIYIYFTNTNMEG